MTDNVVRIPTNTTVPEPAQQVLDKAKEWGCESVLVIGQDEEGNFRFGGNISEGPEIVWLLNRALHWIYDGLP